MEQQRRQTTISDLKVEIYDAFNFVQTKINDLCAAFEQSGQEISRLRKELEERDRPKQVSSEKHGKKNE